MNCFTEEQLNRISHLIKEIEKLSDVEKLFLYLQLPCGRAEGVEGQSKINGSKSSSDIFSKKPDQETTQTYTWILSHLEVDPNVSLPKQEVYDEYRAFCQANRFEPLCVADFGKAMKHAFPCIKPRRLGQRGNSRYCYSGLRKKYKIQPPNLPDMIEPTFCMANDCSQAYNQIIRDCRDNPNECPLNSRPNLTGYEVINLKIEPSSLHNHFQSNGNGLNYNGENSNKQNSSQSQDINGGHTTSTQNTITSGGGNSSSMVTQLTPVSLNEFVPSNPISITRASQMRYNRTPDDDDYLHNYQDILPIDRPLFTTVTPSHQNTSNGQPAASSFIYQQSNIKAPLQESRIDHRPNSMATSSATTTLTNDTNAEHNLGHQNQPHFGGNVNSVVTDPYIHLTHMNSSHIDPCVSPFQSPASTPYPMMGNYMTPDIQDYYSNDCIRYS